MPVPPWPPLPGLLTAKAPCSDLHCPHSSSCGLSHCPAFQKCLCLTHLPLHVCCLCSAAACYLCCRPFLTFLQRLLLQGCCRWRHVGVCGLAPWGPESSVLPRPSAHCTCSSCPRCSQTPPQDTACSCPCDQALCSGTRSPVPTAVPRVSGQRFLSRRYSAASCPSHTRREPCPLWRHTRSLRVTCQLKSSPICVLSTWRSPCPGGAGMPASHPAGRVNTLGSSYVRKPLSQVSLCAGLRLTQQLESQAWPPPAAHSAPLPGP